MEIVYKTPIEIIEETAAYYSKNLNKRAVKMSYTEEGNDESPLFNCVYFDSDTGNKCAFSRCCKDGVSFIKYEGRSAVAVIDELGFDVLKPEYQGVKSGTFWSQLQRLHDLPRYWDNKGLTYAGQEYLKFLKNFYKDYEMK
jgi:hypothetical protein